MSLEALRSGCQTFLEQFASMTGLSTAVTSLFLIITFASPILVLIYFMTRGSPSGTKTWIAVAWSIQVGLFTYLGLAEVWVGLVSIVIPIAVFIAYKVADKLLGGGGM